MLWKALSRQRPNNAHANHSRARNPPRKNTMTPEDLHKLSEDSVAMALTSLSAWTKNAQAIAIEVADFSQKSLAGSAAAWEKVMEAKSLDKAVEVQGQYLRSSYEDFVAQAAKMGGLCADLAKDAYKPFQDVVTRTSATR